MNKVHRMRMVGIGAVLLILALAPFYQGLFFPVPLLAATTLMVTGFGLWVYGRRQDRLGLGLPNGWTGILLLALLLAYLLQFGWASYARGNLDWFLRVAAGWMAFVMLTQENTPQTRRWLSWTFLACTALVAFLGLLEYGRFFEQFNSLREFLGVLKYSGRVFTVFQYPNTAGAVMLAAWTVCMGLLLEETSPRRRALLGGLGSLLSLVVFFTLSRGVILVAPLGVLLLLIGLSRQQIVPVILQLIATGALPLAVAARPILAVADSGNWGLVLLWGLIAVALGGAAARSQSTTLLARVSQRTVVIGLVSLALVGGAAGLYWVGSRAVPGGGAGGIATRLLDISLETQNVQARLEYVYDAVRAFSDQPWGYGGHGWDRTYRQVQQTTYVSRETHNHYAQVLVEGGLLGFLALVGAIASALWTGFRNRHEQPLRWALVASGGILAAHAVVDVDLSYLSVWLLLWALLAMGQNPVSLPAAREPRYAFPVVMTASVLLGLTSLTLATAAISFRQAESAVLSKQYDLALEKAKMAVALDPLNSQHLKLVSTEENLQRAVTVDPHNSLLWRDLAAYRQRKNDLPGALEAALRAVELSPMHTDRYIAYFQIAGTLLDMHVEGGKRTEAVSLANSVVAMAAEIGHRRLQAQSRPAQPYPLLARTHQQHLTLGKALMLTGSLQAAEENLLAAAKEESMAADASLWLLAIYRMQQVEKPVPVPNAVSAPKSQLFQALLKW